MILLLLAALILSVIGTGALVTWRFSLKIETKQAEIEHKLDIFVRSFIESPEPGAPSKLAEIVEIMGATVARSMIKEVSVQSKAENSHVSRVANNITQDIIAEQNPLLGLLSGTKRGKGAAVLKLAELLAPMLSKGNNQQLGLPMETYIRKHRE